MSNVNEGQVELVGVRGPFQAKNGKDFEFHEYTVKGVKMSKIMPAGSDLEASEGQNVRVIYTSTQNGKFTNNRVDKLDILLAKPTLKATEVEEILASPDTQTESKSIQKRKIAQTSVTQQGTTFNNKGARVGGVLHDAVAFVVATAGNQASLNDVETVATKLLEIANRLEA